MSDSNGRGCNFATTRGCRTGIYSFVKVSARRQCSDLSRKKKSLCLFGKVERLQTNELYANLWGASSRPLLLRKFSSTKRRATLTAFG